MRRSRKSTSFATRRVRRRLLVARIQAQRLQGQLQAVRIETGRLCQKVGRLERAMERSQAAASIASAIAQERYGPTSIKPPKTADAVVALQELCRLLPTNETLVDLNDVVRMSVLLQRLDLPAGVEVRVETEETSMPAFEAGPMGWLVAAMVGWAAEIILRSGRPGIVEVATRLNPRHATVTVRPKSSTGRYDRLCSGAYMVAVSPVGQLRAVAVRTWGAVLRISIREGLPVLSIDLPRSGSVPVAA